jgi:hypothetical protein
MFIAAVARPRYDFNRRGYFNSKIGIWPIIERLPAKRSSKLRPKGTLITTPVSVNGAVYRSLIIDKIIPAIKMKMPATMKYRKIYIQQDNAGPHSAALNDEILNIGHSDGWMIELTNQPPNSPDFNILDLGFFNSIQSLQYQAAPKCIDELINAVEQAFEPLPFDPLAKTFITLQKVFDLSIGLRGSNSYKLPHMHKCSSIAEFTTYNVDCDLDSVEMELLRPNVRLEEESEIDEIVGRINDLAFQI